MTSVAHVEVSVRTGPEHGLSDEQCLLQEELRRFAEEKIGPGRARHYCIEDL